MLRFAAMVAQQQPGALLIGPDTGYRDWQGWLTEYLPIVDKNAIAPPMVDSVSSRRSSSSSSSSSHVVHTTAAAAAAAAAAVLLAAKPCGPASKACCNPATVPAQLCPGGISCEACGGGNACECPTAPSPGPSPGPSPAPASNTRLTVVNGCNSGPMCVRREESGKRERSNVTLHSLWVNTTVDEAMKKNREVIVLQCTRTVCVVSTMFIAGGPNTYIVMNPSPSPPPPSASSLSSPPPRLPGGSPTLTRAELAPIRRMS